MNCFEHPQKPALGTCTFCGRGLCRDCSAVVQGKLACRGACQDEVARERELMQKSERALDERSVVYKTSGNMYHQAFAITVFFGVIFMGFGALLVIAENPVIGGILVGLGAILTMRGVSLGRAGKSFMALAAEDSEAGSKS